MLIKSAIYLGFLAIASTESVAADFNISSLPINPEGNVDNIEGLATFSVYQTETNQESLVTRFSSYIGDCATCSRGIALNCDFKPQAKGAGSGEKCHRILKNGVGFRLRPLADGMGVEIKNGTGMAISGNKTGSPAIVADGETANFVFNQTKQETSSLKNIRLEIVVWTKRDRSERNTAEIPLFDRNLPGELVKLCQDNARALVEHIVEIDPNTRPYKEKSGPVEIKFWKASTWLSAPHDGTAIYHATVPMKEGWSCDYRIDMAMHLRADPTPGFCGLASLHFKMCSK